MWGVRFRGVFGVGVGVGVWGLAPGRRHGDARPPGACRARRGEGWKAVRRPTRARGGRGGRRCACSGGGDGPHGQPRVCMVRRGLGVWEVGVSCELRDTSGAHPREKRERRVRICVDALPLLREARCTNTDEPCSTSCLSLRYKSVARPSACLHRETDSPNRCISYGGTKLQRGSVRLAQCLRPMLCTALYNPDPQFSFPWSKDLCVSKNSGCLQTDESEGAMEDRNGHLVSLVRGGNLSRVPPGIFEKLSFECGFTVFFCNLRWPQSRTHDLTRRILQSRAVP